MVMSTYAEQATPATRLLDRLAERGEGLATAESITGGLLSTVLTDVPGASRVVVGAVVSYATELKVELLGVPQEVVDGPGVVSAQCAEAMAQGVRRVTGAEWAISTTGEAGPAASGDAPVGTVWIGVAGPDASRTHRLDLGPDGGRAGIRAAAVTAALDLALDVVPPVG
jgi:nicotinamide-nucleotide amidase